MSEIEHKHLLIDLRIQDYGFLTSISDGIAVLRKCCQEANLNIRESFAYEFPNGSYSCGFILAESHVSLHTWPEHRYCAVDLFLCDGDSTAFIESILTMTTPSRSAIRTVRRSPSSRQWVPDLSGTYTECYRADEVMAVEKSQLQKIMVANSKELGSFLLLDDDLQVASVDEHLYHEYLVNPPLLAHSKASRVLILGGGDGGALRDVLKFANVDHVTLVDIDERVIATSRRFLGSLHHNSFDDPRVEIQIADAYKYVLNCENRFDIVIVDLTAPAAAQEYGYSRIVNNLDQVLAEGGFYSLHTSWWETDFLASFNNKDDYREKIIIANRWIPSFRCSWSFILGWLSDNSPSDIARALRKNSPRESGFNVSDYLSNALAPLNV